MEIASLIIAIMAVLLAGASVVYTHRADGRAKRAEERAKNADARAIRAEERAEREAVERRSARPIVTPSGGSGGPSSNTVTYIYEVTNAGHATITELLLWHEDDHGNSISTGAGAGVVLAPNERATLSLRVLSARPAKQKLWVSWADSEGHHTEFTGYEPPPAM